MAIHVRLILRSIHKTIFNRVSEEFCPIIFTNDFLDLRPRLFSDINAVFCPYLLF